MTEHNQPRTLKALLPPVPVPEDFEYQLWLRRALRQLPTVSVPEAFEETLLQRLRAEQGLTAWRRGALLSLLVAVLVSSMLGLWHFLQPPVPLTPFRSPVHSDPIIVTADQRFTAPPQRPPLHITGSARRSSSPVPGGIVPLPPPEE